MGRAVWGWQEWRRRKQAPKLRARGSAGTGCFTCNPTVMSWKFFAHRRRPATTCAGVCKNECWQRPRSQRRSRQLAARCLQATGRMNDQDLILLGGCLRNRPAAASLAAWARCSVSSDSDAGPLWGRRSHRLVGRSRVFLVVSGCPGRQQRSEAPAPRPPLGAVAVSSENGSERDRVAGELCLGPILAWRTSAARRRPDVDC